MGRWTQHEEDATRLPEGVKRIGYDADTARYKFCDREGNHYLGPPHEDYGSLTLVGKTSRRTSFTDDRPHAFASEDGRPELSVDVRPPGQGSTFHDILPPHLIASPSSAESTLSASSLGRESPATSRFRDAVRRTALPSMANVVNNVRRSTTMLRKPRARDKEKDGLLRSDTSLAIDADEYLGDDGHLGVHRRNGCQELNRCHIIRGNCIIGVDN
ncbi:hypothetical protein MVEN_01797600 [Mycena venus]|uniref:Carbohydrate-binding module family 50 protein n=1 Tax=Mycena venus TaxID=2733690 RepID=A0A8H7CNU6_9AGAR|nr:hypothetical protein MVEN_01797600 [Mycena venus]